MYCPNCGTTVNDTATSCGNCKLDLSRGTAFAPYNPGGENSFMLGISLLTLFPLLGLLLPVAVDSGIVKILGLAITVICPIVGAAAVFMATSSDKNHQKDNEPASRKSAKSAKMISMAGWAVGFPVATLAMGIAFFNFLSGGGHDEGHKKKAEVVEAATETGDAPAEAAPAGEAAPAAEAAPAKEDAPK